MKKIPLTKGQTAIVCDCHYDEISKHKWHVLFDRRRNTYYAVRNSLPFLGRRHNIFMHAVINGTPQGYETDHKNHNTLDNQCSNLRTVTHGQNVINRRRFSNNTSGHIGVGWSNRQKAWQARIQRDHKSIHLGFFEDKTKAIQARKEAEVKLFGHFASSE